VFLASGFHTSALAFLALAPFVIGDFSPLNLLIGSAVAAPGLYHLASREEFTLYFDRYVGAGVDAAGAPFRGASLTLVGLLFFLAMKHRWRR
ncbi:hypothetical protein, partial [Vibrio cholerae]|uniref:hypothetical protein n=1 Tax=Vibrio cholerae TaxID=666 RepID=UPI003D7CCC7B